MKSLRSRACTARLTLLCIVITAFSFSTGSIGQEAFKLGVVNTEEVLKGSAEATKATETLRAAGERLQKQLQEKADAIRTIQEEKAKTQLFVEDAQTADLDNQILQLQQEYQRDREIGQQALLEKERELLEPIYKSLEELIINVGKAENYDIILEKRLITLYVKDEYDLTKKFIELMNQNNENGETPE